MWQLGGMFGMAALFLVISPNLRHTVYSGLEFSLVKIDAYSPYSYIGAGVAVLILGLITLARGGQARAR